MNSTVAAIEIRDLEKTYTRGLKRHPVHAVRGISLTVAQGEAFGFVGPNGAGKSSTIRILMGLARPSAGTIHLFGKAVADPASRLRIGYVPESPYLYDYLTPREILSMNMSLHRIPKVQIADRCGEWLEHLRIHEVGDTPIRSFSKGMTQRVALAQAMCIEPRLLILDEPLSGLDPIGRREVVELLAAYKDAGGTLFFTSHVLHDVERLADRFGLIHRGKLFAVRSPAELVNSEEMVLVRAAGTESLPGWRREAPSRWATELPRSELWVTLERLHRSGFDIVEVQPTLSLEAAVLKAVTDSETRDD